DRAESSRLPHLTRRDSRRKCAEVSPVETGMLVPEGEILGIKCPLGHHGLVAHERPVDSIGGLESEQPPFGGKPSERLESGFSRAVGAGIEKRSEIMTPDSVPDDVILF